MNDFEYAAPRTEAEAVTLLGEQEGNAAVLAAGTDLVSLMQQGVVRPGRVVDISGIDSLKGVEVTPEGVQIGALTTMEEILDSPVLADYPALGDVAEGIRAIQIQQNGTLGGDLCHLPNCWYFRKGYGLLATENGRSLAAEGDNRYHAIFGNQGAAKFVNASRFAPSLIAWHAEVRVVGPDEESEQWLPLEQFYRTPKLERQGTNILAPGQFISHIRLPNSGTKLSACYEVLELEGLDWPLSSCAVTLSMEAGIVREACIVLGQVAPVPWVSYIASSVVRGQPLTPETAARAGEAAVSEATPLWNNEYKVQLARASVKRALLKATGQLEL
ncbi:Carbon monoxide dehydrogenase medium chain [Maioricimonas rarisocia]|uniref:Carbon monoxide dehydrogenase medium chain n=1 Tax=Maioricimonas rarisocia TaxID=2528026 RepID=A0A517Z5Q6_9PLAN|nr:FAD binding domain-containing protein [Maioricimonas rarisocia]QDU37830.1 Carbon monoxide dehydrogenase medium chain [Maioricimonas rarisocia]